MASCSLSLLRSRGTVKTAATVGCRGSVLATTLKSPSLSLPSSFLNYSCRPLVTHGTAIPFSHNLKQALLRSTPRLASTRSTPLAWNYSQRYFTVTSDTTTPSSDKKDADTSEAPSEDTTESNETPVVRLDDEPLTVVDDFDIMSNEELTDTSTIPGWSLIHSPPRKYPRGALVGTVVSDRMMKTVNVAVDRYRMVPKIRKRVKYTRKFMAHDEQEVANMGDLVMITPCHRISKRKHFMLREIIRPKGQM